MSSLPGGVFDFDFSPTPQVQKVPDVVEPLVLPDLPSGVPALDPGGVAPVSLPVVSDQQFGNMYSASTVDSRYDWDYGFVQVPVAAPGGPCEIVSTHAPICQRIVEWTVERLNQAPVAPSWVTNNPNETLVEKMISPASSAMASDGSLVYRRSGRYVYALRYPPDDSDYLFAGAPSYLTVPPSSFNVVPATDFDANLSDASSTIPKAFLP